MSGVLNPGGGEWVPFEPKPQDVISTKRRDWNNTHPGNLNYTAMLEDYAKRLPLSSNHEKYGAYQSEFADTICRTIIEQNKGRFLKIFEGETNPEECLWMNYKAAIHKVYHALKNKQLSMVKRGDKNIMGQIPDRPPFSVQNLPPPLPQPTPSKRVRIPIKVATAIEDRGATCPDGNLEGNITVAGGSAGGSSNKMRKRKAAPNSDNVTRPIKKQKMSKKKLPTMTTFGQQQTNQPKLSVDGSKRGRPKGWKKGADNSALYVSVGQSPRTTSYSSPKTSPSTKNNKPPSTITTTTTTTPKPQHDIISITAKKKIDPPQPMIRYEAKQMDFDETDNDSNSSSNNENNNVNFNINNNEHHNNASTNDENNKTKKKPKIDPYALELITTVCNNYQHNDAYWWHLLETPIPKYWMAGIEETDKERLIRLQLRHRFISARALRMPVVDFARRLLEIWGGILVETTVEPIELQPELQKEFKRQEQELKKLHAKNAYYAFQSETSSSKGKANGRTTSNSSSRQLDNDNDYFGKSKYSPRNSSSRRTSEPGSFAESIWGPAPRPKKRASSGSASATARFARLKNNNKTYFDDNESESSGVSEDEEEEAPQPVSIVKSPRKGNLPGSLLRKSNRNDPRSWLTWEERIEQLMTYRSVYGHANVSTSRKDPHFELGQWLAAQRSVYRKGTMKPERIRDMRRCGCDGFGGEKKKERLQLNASLLASPVPPPLPVAAVAAVSEPMEEGEVENQATTITGEPATVAPETVAMAAAGEAAAKKKDKEGGIIKTEADAEALAEAVAEQEINGETHTDEEENDSANEETKSSAKGDNAYFSAARDKVNEEKVEAESDTDVEDNASENSNDGHDTANDDDNHEEATYSRLDRDNDGNDDQVEDTEDEGESDEEVDNDGDDDGDDDMDTSVIESDEDD